MKVLVTGGAGFIGSSLTSKLLSLKKNVVVIDNFEPFYNPEEKKRNIAPFSSDKNFKLITGDIRKREEMLEIFRKEKFETVVHLAAKAGVRPSIKDPVGYAETNIKGTLNVLDAARDTGVKNFIFGSSSSVYGERSEVPFSESDMADNPISPYGLTKLSSEKTCRVYNNLFGLKTTVLRFFTVYGPGQRPDLAIRKFIQLISEGQEIEMYGDGSSMRDYTYVDDIVEGILSALSSPRDFNDLRCRHDCSGKRFNKIL